MKITVTYSGDDNHNISFYDEHTEVTVSQLTTEDLRVIRDRTNYFITLVEERQRLKELEDKTIEYVWNPKSRRHEKIEK